MECPICCEKYNKTTRKQIACICEKHCCRGCMKKYIETKTEDVHCMFCKVKWNRDFLHDNFDKNYIQNDYKVYRENILFEKEMGMLPATQPFVEKELKIEELAHEANIINVEREALNRKYYAKIREIELLKNTRSVERKRYVHKCPSNNCHGFLSTQLKCELCNIWVCSECREIKGTNRDDAHTCNPEILETIKLLNNDSKPCPTCSSIIYKIEGCNQMFCTECHVAFDWTTLRIQTGLIHNPHYFEWQRRVNNNEFIERNPNDILCGRELENRLFNVIQRKFVDKYNLEHPLPCPIEYNEKFLNIIREHTNNTQLINKINLEINKIRFLTMSDYEYAYTCYNKISYSLVSPSSTPTEDMKIIDNIVQVLKNVLPVAKYMKKINNISNIIRRTIHIREVELIRWNNMDRLNNNLDLRIAYMRNKIGVDYFKFNIQKKDKEAQRNTEYGNVLRMYISCMTDLLYRLNDNIDDYDAILHEMHELRHYTNDAINKTLILYNSTLKRHINDEFSYEMQRAL